MVFFYRQTETPFFPLYLSIFLFHSGPARGDNSRWWMAFGRVLVNEGYLAQVSANAAVFDAKRKPVTFSTVGVTSKGSSLLVAAGAAAGGTLSLPLIMSQELKQTQRVIKPKPRPPAAPIHTSGIWTAPIAAATGSGTEADPDQVAASTDDGPQIPALHRTESEPVDPAVKALEGELYRHLLAWRQQQATLRGCAPFMICNNHVLAALATTRFASHDSVTHTHTLHPRLDFYQFIISSHLLVLVVVIIVEGTCG